MAAQHYLMLDGDKAIAEGDLETVTRAGSDCLVACEPPRLRLFRVEEVQIQVTPPRGPTVELVRAPRAEKEQKPARAPIRCPIEGCTSPGAGGRRRGFCEGHWALVPPADRPRKLAEAEDKQRLIGIVQAALATKQ